MAVSYFQLECVRGLSFSVALSLADAGLNIDLGDFRVSMEVRNTRSTSSRLIASFDEQNGKLSADRASMIVNIALEPDDTLALPMSKGYYAIQLAEIYDLHTGVTKEAFRVLEGRFDIVSPTET